MMNEIIKKCNVCTLGCKLKESALADVFIQLYFLCPRSLTFAPAPPSIDQAFDDVHNYFKIDLWTPDEDTTAVVSSYTYIVMSIKGETYPHQVTVPLTADFSVGLLHIRVSRATLTNKLSTTSS